MGPDKKSDDLDLPGGAIAQEDRAAINAIEGIMTPDVTSQYLNPIAPSTRRKNRAFATTNEIAAELANANNPQETLQTLGSNATSISDASVLRETLTEIAKAAQEAQIEAIVTSQAETEVTNPRALQAAVESQAVHVDDKGISSNPINPNFTSEGGMGKVARSKRNERLSATHDLTIGDFYNQAFFNEYPQFFHSSNKESLAKHGLRLASIRVSELTEATAAKIHQYCPQTICLATDTIPNSQDIIIHLVVDQKDLPNFAQRLFTDPNIIAVVLGGNNAKPIQTISGITLIGRDIEHNNKTLRSNNPPKISAGNKIAPNLNDTINQITPLQRRSPREIEAAEIKELPTTNSFIIQIKLPTGLSNCDIEYLQHQIAEMAIIDRGCNIQASGNEILVIGIHERPDYTAMLLKDLQTFIAEKGIQEQTVLKYVHGPIAVENRHKVLTSKEISNNVFIPTIKMVTGKAINTLDSLPDTPGQIPISGFEMFTNDDRYRVGLKVTKKIYIAPDGTEKEIEILEEITINPKRIKRSFVLRGKEQACLQELQEKAKNTFRFCYVDGVAGVGKSSLLLHSLSEDDTIIVPPHKGRGKLGLIDFASQLTAMIGNYNLEDHFPPESKELKYLKASVNELKGFAKKGAMLNHDQEDYYNTESYVTYALDLIQFLGARKKEEGSIFCISFDDLDDFEGESLSAVRKILEKLASSQNQGEKGNPKYANIVAFMTLRSDVSFTEGSERNKRAQIGNNTIIEHQTTMRSIKMLATDQLTVKYLVIAHVMQDGSIKLAKELQDFIVGKTLQKLQGGTFSEFIAETRVSNFDSFAALIISRAGQKNGNNEIEANPYLMVQVINELLAENLIGFNQETNEIRITNYDKAEREIPKDPEGIREKQFRRLAPGQQETALYLSLLDGLEADICGKMLFIHLDEETQNELVKEREMIRIDKQGKIKMATQWKGYLQRKLSEDPQTLAKMQKQLLDALLEIDNDTSSENNFQSCVDPIKICHLSTSSIESGDSAVKMLIAEKYALPAAEAELENQNYQEALNYAKLYLASSESRNKEFEANLIAMEACIYINEFDEAAKFGKAINRKILPEDQQLQLAQVLCENAYLNFKNSEFGGGSTTNEALDKYNTTITDFKETLEATTIGKALYFHHMSIALSERLGKALFNHEEHGNFFGVDYDNNSDKQRELAYKRAIKFATLADKILSEIQPKDLTPKEQRLKIANTTLLGTLCLSSTQIEHNRSNLSIVKTIQDQNDQSEKAQRTRKRIDTAIEFAKKGLSLAGVYRIALPSLKSRAATCITVSSLLKGDTKNIEDLVQNTLIQAINLPPKARLNVLLHTLSAAIEHCKGAKATPAEVKTYLMTIGYDLTAEVNEKYPNLYFAVFNHAEASILKAITTSSPELAQIEHMQATNLIKEHAQLLKENDDNRNLQVLLQKHMLVAKALGGQALTLAEDMYKTLFSTWEERDKYIEQPPALDVVGKAKDKIMTLIRATFNHPTPNQKATEIKDLDGLMNFDEKKANSMLHNYLPG